jgi:hypothetical protein
MGGTKHGGRLHAGLGAGGQGKGEQGREAGEAAGGAQACRGLLRGAPDHATLELLALKHALRHHPACAGEGAARLVLIMAKP